MNKIRNFAAAALVAGGIAVAVAAVGGQPTETTAGAPVRAASAPSSAMATSREFFNFDSVQKMTATSSAVVDGHVIRVEPGRSDGSGHDPDKYLNVIVQVDELLAGQTPQTITIEELLLTDSEGNRILLDGVQYSQPGDRGVYFVRAKPAGTYALISSQGRYLEGDDGRLKGSNENDKLVKEIAKLDKESLKDQIKAAAKASKEGKITPLPYPEGLEKVQ